MKNFASENCKKISRLMEKFFCDIFSPLSLSRKKMTMKIEISFGVCTRMPLVWMGTKMQKPLKIRLYCCYPTK